ncbi:ATP-dependent RNA helicase RhlB [Planctomicrobium sp. SH664]|uniref:ATP-dependent RNA helicase RhlB n=1 Tax=Planctomicrobium sp. SH664 TaxID=3448125 RepID=UPI003F5B8D4A
MPHSCQRPIHRERCTDTTGNRQCSAAAGCLFRKFNEKHLPGLLFVIGDGGHQHGGRCPVPGGGRIDSQRAGDPLPPRKGPRTQRESIGHAIKRITVFAVAPTAAVDEPAIVGGERHISLRIGES